MRAVRMLGFATALIGALFALEARAADLAVKAQPALIQNYPTGNGIFLGFNALADGGTANSSVAIAQTALYGGSLGANIGYTGTLNFGGAPSFYFFDAMFDFSTVNTTSPAVTGLQLSRTIDFEQRYAIGTSLSNVAKWVSWFPGLSSVSMPSIPNLPNGITVGPQNPYVFVSTHEEQISGTVLNSFGSTWAFSWGAGAGVLSRLSNGWMLDTWVEYKNESSALIVGPVPASVSLGDSFKAGVSVKFGAGSLAGLVAAF